MLSDRNMKFPICIGADCVISAHGGGGEGYRVPLVRFFKIYLSDKNLNTKYGCVRRCDGGYF